MTDLHYLSERLAGELIQEQEAREAGQPPVEKTSDFDAVKTKDLGKPIKGNPFSLAEHAEQIVLGRDEAGDLELPGRFALIRNTRVRLWVFRTKAERAPLTVLASVRRDPHMAVLIGSPKNMRGWNSERQIDGWVPSDPIGLRQVIRELRDDSGDTDLGALDWTEAIDAASDFAINLTRTPDLDMSADVLARIYASEDSVSVGWRTTGHPVRYEFARVLVGAPVFIREPFHEE